MASEKIFQGLITDEGIDKARNTQTTQGWLISPYEFYLSETSGEFLPTRTSDTMNETWYHGKFSAINKISNNKIIVTITLAGDEDAIQRKIKEIYLKCKALDGSEFLYVLIQPLIDMTFVPTVSQEMSFLITLSNTNKEDIYTIQYVDTTKLNSYQLVTEKGQNSGYCPLGANGIVPDYHLPLRDNLPIGTVVPIFCTKDYIPTGYLPCNGAEYTYAEFPSVYNDYLLTGKLPTCNYTEYQNSLNTYGSCAKFGLDTANAKFKVPSIADGTFLQQANSDSRLSYLSKFSIVAGDSNRAVSLRWFVLVTHGLINASISDWSAWVNQLNVNTNNIQSILDWDIGVPVPMVTNDLPANYIRLEGASVLITDYPKLWAKYGATWGQVDSTHFTLPNFKNRAVWGYTSVGYLAQSLPTVTVPRNGWSCGGGWGHQEQPKGTLLASSGKWESSEYLESIGGTTANRAASVGGTIRPASITVRFITRYQ